MIGHGKRKPLKPFLDRADLRVCGWLANHMAGIPLFMPIENGCVFGGG